MRWFIIFYFITFRLNSYSQDTFSRLIDIDLAIDNALTDLEVSDEFLFVSALHLCEIDTNNNILNQCSSVSKYDLSAKLIDKILLDTFFPEGLNRLLLDNKRLFLSGHFHGEFDGRPTTLLEFNDGLDVDSIFEFSSNIGTVPNNEGITEFNNSLYLFGYKLIYNENKKYSHIIKIDKETKAVDWDKIYSHAAWKNECYDLQPTIDGNLIYIQYFNDGVGSGGESGFQIVKIDTTGIIRDSFEFEDIGIDNPRILASKEGSVYFTSQDPPYPHTIPSNGRINKISSDLDSLEWSLELPSNPFIDAHRYKIYDYLQSANGDIVACGTVWHEGPDGPIGTPNNHTWNGFIVRVTQNGELKWLRIYRHPNTHPDLPKDEFGDFRPSLLSKVYETDKGRFIVGGTVYYNGIQDSALPLQETKSVIWLMTVDETGCVEGEECTEVIILDNKNNLSPNFHIGTKWTYETIEYPLPIKTSYQIFQITDTTKFQGKNVFIIQDEFGNIEEYMYVNNSEVYFWDTRSQTFQLTYDFGSDSFYTSYWENICDSTSGNAIINIDSITSILLESDTLQVQHITIRNNGSSKEDLHNRVYKEIGLMEGGLRLPLGISCGDFPFIVTKLRCFENDSLSYNFVGYPCDSTWFTTSTTHIDDVTQLLYPNPTSGILHIKNIDMDVLYELYTIEGKRVQSGVSNNGEIYIDNKGIFILRIFMDFTWNNLKLVVF